MLDAATYTPRLKAHYAGTVRAALKEEFGYKNDMQIPRLDKIVLNIGAGAEAVRDSKKAKSALPGRVPLRCGGTGERRGTTRHRRPCLRGLWGLCTHLSGGLH